MSIQKKSLISTLKSAKKVNIMKGEVSLDHSQSSIKAQPIVKLSGKTSAVYKLTTKATTKVKAAQKAALKS
jgi:hypothetical protein